MYPALERLFSGLQSQTLNASIAKYPKDLQLQRQAKACLLNSLLGFLSYKLKEKNM